MSTLHTIRLRGPWTCEIASHELPSGESTCHELTDDELPTDDSASHRLAVSERHRFTAPDGLSQLLNNRLSTAATTPTPLRLRLRRTFHAPPGLASSARVELVFNAVCPGRLWLNQQLLGEFAVGQFRCEIGDMLQPNLQLVVDLLWDAQQLEQLTCDARLEIH